MKVALVYDRINKFGGAERVLMALHEIWPDAPLFTAVYNPSTAGWASVFEIHPSFLNRFPLAQTHHEFYPWLTPLAFESFRFDGFDVVISVTSAEAKGILTKPETLHICYCLTPTRYLWSGLEVYTRQPGMGTLNPLIRPFHRAALATLRNWDRIASNRPDSYLSISKAVSERIEAYYGQKNVSVVYPPVDTDLFTVGSGKRGEYFLTVSRLVGYKRLDIVIDACNALQVPLIIIGQGKARSELISRAGPTVRILSDHLTDKELLHYYQQCRAFLFAGVEDFGIAMVEAQACGKPVVSFGKGGALEIIEEGKTGEFFRKQSPDGLTSVLQRFDETRYDTGLVRRNALRFSKRRFQDEFRSIVHRVYDTYRRESL